MGVYSVGDQAGDPNSWVQTFRGDLLRGLHTRGACLLRGLPVDVEIFHDTVSTIGRNLLEYTERSTPRSAVSGNIYTSTDYPADQSIPMHNESSYSHRWPELLFFFCHTAAESGGATPVADSRAVFRSLSERTRDLFAGGVLYTRTFRDGLGLSWQESFQTEDRAVVEEYCRRNGHEFEWTGDGLRTRHRRPGYLREPRTGDLVWFNQANLFHISSLEPDVREALLELGTEQDLPRNAYLGDGSPIPAEAIAEIEAAYARTSLAVPWRPGDVMVVNNMLMAHGRRPYSGERRILVAMS